MPVSLACASLLFQVADRGVDRRDGLVELFGR
jgi:hypothetical protein